MANEQAVMKLKLIVDIKSQKVLFAESGKDFVDFMFSLLTLSLGSVVKLFSPRIMIGSIGKLNQSVENLKESYLVEPSGASVDGVSLPCTDAMDKLNYYLSSSCNRKVTTTRITDSPTYRSGIFGYPPAPATSSAAGTVTGGDNVGFVKGEGVITYMITDDLEVMPMSAISSITLINRFRTTKDNVQLEEKSVVVGMKEGVALLEFSLESATVLTDVFLSSREKSEAPS